MEHKPRSRCVVCVTLLIVAGIQFTITPARDSMCARCWKHAVQKDGEELCPRCRNVLR
jgi:hypothetical protein